MPDPTIYDLRLQERRQRRKVDILRQQFVASLTSGAQPALSPELIAAEHELQRLEEARMRQELGGGGLLLNVRTAQGSQFMGPHTTGLEVAVLLRQSHVPTGSVHLMDAEKNPLVTFKIRYLGDEYARVRVTSFVEEYSARSITTVELDEDRPACEIHHLPTFFPERLRQVTELTRATLHIQIDDLDKAVEQENTFPIWLLARTSAFLWITDPVTSNRIDLSYTLAAWVTPNAPEIMRLLRRAADLLPDGQITGYQAKPAGVEAQVKAIFEVLKEQKIHYVNSTLCFGASQGELMQRIRLPSESLATQSANCIDGTVLMASVLEAATLNPAIVLLPGHAFLAWERAEDSGDWDYLETTMIGSHSFEQAHQAGQLQQAHDITLLLPLAELRLKYGVTPME